MKVWARYAVPVMVLVDEQEDSIERVVMLPGERFIDRETMGDMLFIPSSSSRSQAAASRPPTRCTSATPTAGPTPRSGRSRKPSTRSLVSLTSSATRRALTATARLPLARR